MDKYKRLTDKLGRRDKVHVATTSFFDEPTLIERMNRDDLDFLLLDMEHGRFNTESMRIQLYICRTLGLPSIVRVQDTAYHLISKTIDMGADGIMLPRTESLDQLRTAIDGIHFYPIGKKGYGGAAQFRNGEDFDGFQKGRFLFPQIESPKGIDNLRVMLREYGEHISGIIVGPFDLSVMLGVPGDIHNEKMITAFKKVIDTCQDMKMSVGIYCRSIADAALYKEMGTNIFWLNTDLDLYIDGYKRAFDALSML